MAKKKKQKANRKKEGAAAKTSSHSTTNERRATNADFRLFHSIDEGMPLFSQTIVQNANHHIQNQSLGSKEQERLLKKMDAIYNKDVGDWVLTLYTTIITGEFYSLGPYTRVVFDKFVFLVKNAISATKKKDVLIDGMEIQIVAHLMCSMMHVMFTDEDDVINEDAVLDLLESLTNTMKSVSDKRYSSSGAAYVMCHFMMYCYTLFSDKRRDAAKPMMMIAKSGILEQVLLHIDLSWSPQVDEQALLDGYHGSLYKFFGLLNSHAGVVHKIFKEGTACHKALDAIVQDGIRPCKENEHMMNLLQSLKKISDLSSYKPVEKQGSVDEVVIDMDEDVNPSVNFNRHTCAKCEKVDLDKQLRVCAKCKYSGYCSKECQVSDWKDHKLDCDYFRRNKYKTLHDITWNFICEHCDLIHEKVKAARLKTGLCSIELAIDLNFTSALGEVAPALRSPPEFEVLPASIFWNREKDKAPANHWVFEDLGGGETYYSDDDVKEIRESASSSYKMYGKDHVFVFLNFGKMRLVTFWTL